MNTLNTFEEQLTEYFGGSTGSALGPDVKSSYLEDTKSNIFSVGLTPETLGKGVEMYAVPGAGPPESALIDFHSQNNPGNQIFDVRIEATGGESNVFGRGSLNFFANIYGFNGNAINTKPSYWMFGDIVNRPVPINPSVNQGRLYAMQSVNWSGVAANANPNPALTIQLRDPVSLTNWFGVFDVQMSSAFGGGGRVFTTCGWVIAKNASPPTNIVETRIPPEGPDLSNFYAEADWNVAGYPQLLLYNKVGGTNFVYMVRGMIFPDNDGF